MSRAHIAMTLLTIAYLASAFIISAFAFNEGYEEGKWEGRQEARKAQQQGWTFGDEHLDQPPTPCYQKYAPGHPPCCNGHCS